MNPEVRREAGAGCRERVRGRVWEGTPAAAQEVENLVEQVVREIQQGNWDTWVWERVVRSRFRSG
jgi:hypothetical protein